MRVPLAGSLLLMALLCPGIHAQAEGRGTRPLVFLGNQALPPMVYVEGGKAKGIVVDLVKRLSEEMGRPIELRPANWAQAQKDLAEGRVDALVQINKTESRLRIYDFSGPLLASRFSIFVRRGSQGIASAADLQGLKVGVEPTGYPELILRADPLVTLVTISTILDGFLQLQAGRIDALVADQWVGQYILAVNRIRDLEIVGEPVAVSLSAIAVRKGDQGLLDSINAGLERMRKDGSYQAILDRWHPKGIVYLTEEQIEARNIRFLATAIGLVLLLSLAFILVLLRRLSAERALKAELSESEAKYRAIFAAESDALFLVERATGRILDCNENALRLYGYPREELVGALNTVTSAEPELTIETTRNPVNLIPLRYHRKKDGTVFPVEITLSVSQLNGVEVVISAARDITERVEASRKITALLKEKDLILREAHHRIKNNMASIISLLSFQRRAHEDSPAGTILLEAMAKVQSMGILYDKLYRSADTGAIDVGEYLSGLLERALDLYERRDSIALRVEVAAMTMDAERLAPLGIVLNELLTNSIKHAFGECPEPRIEVEGRLSGTDLILVYRDNGRGLPEGPPSEGSPGFGLQLIDGLVAQLNGTVQAESAGGARYTLHIPA